MTVDAVNGAIQMARRVRSYSRLTEEALLLLGKQIKLARISRRRSGAELASRVGIARSTLQKIEQGDPGVEIGLAFEAAILAGLPLFEPEASTLAPKIERMEDKLALLPKSARRRRKEVKDDF